MVVMDLVQSLWRFVEKKQKNLAIFAHFVMLHCHPPLDGRTLDLPPIRLIVAVLHRILAVLKVFWRRIYVVVAW